MFVKALLFLSFFSVNAFAADAVFTPEDLIVSSVSESAEPLNCRNVISRLDRHFEDIEVFGDWHEENWGRVEDVLNSWYRQLKPKEGRTGRFRRGAFRNIKVSADEAGEVKRSTRRQMRQITRTSQRILLQLEDCL